MAVSNPRRNIPRDYKPELSLAHLAKKATGGSLPSRPTKPPANQPKDDCSFLTGMTPVNLRYRGLARTPGLRAAFAARGLRRWIHGNNQPATAAVATRRLWIGCCFRS